MVRARRRIPPYWLSFFERLRSPARVKTNYLSGCRIITRTETSNLLLKRAEIIDPNLTETESEAGRGRTAHSEIAEFQCH